MHGLINDGLRAVVGPVLRLAGGLAELRHLWRIRFFHWSQARLKRRYRIRPDTPITNTISALDPQGAEGEQRPSRARLAKTSGSTGQPREIPYTDARLGEVRRTFIDVFLRCFWKLDISRTSLYVFGSFNDPDSLTALLLDEDRLPAYLATLQAPYRVERHPALQTLRKRYGTAALRLWVITLSNPGVLYSTNPSTLSTFFDELGRDWEASSAMVRDYVQEPETFPAPIHGIARRLVSHGSGERLERVASSRSFMPMADWAPGVDTYVCWTGGYVAPFLERVRVYLPAGRYRLVPMYSMSTETIETVGHFDRDRVVFLPLAPAVFYEFLEVDVPDTADNLLPVSQLKTGGTYRMVVSHAWGARRYQTGDVFLVKERVQRLPDLRFLRRHGLAYSFTGEKLTGDQLTEAYSRLGNDYPALDGAGFLTCFPSQPPTEPVPHYKVTLVRRDEASECALSEIAARCDRLLEELNLEYRNKREGQRLGPVRFQQISLADFRRLMSGSAPVDFDAQFKFLPLYPCLWESLDQP